MYRVTPLRLAKALARDGLCIVLRAVLRAIEAPPLPTAPQPSEWTIKVYGEDGRQPMRVLSRETVETGRNG